MAGFYQGTDPDIDPGSAQQSAQLAQEWAIKLDGPVEGSSYSSQYNSNLAGASAQEASASAASAASSAQTAQDAAAGLGSIALNDLIDVDAPSPNDGDVLKWSAANGKWEAVAP